MDPRSPHFGTGRLAEALLKRIDAAFDAPAPSEPALVVGVFGEWGSGKSTLLQEVQRGVQDMLEKQQKAPLPSAYTVPIWFNAWQYEREPHLVIPLLKTAKLAVDKAFQASVTTDEALRQGFAAKLELLTDLTVAAAQSLDVKLDVPGVGSVSLDAPWKFWKHFQSRRKERAEDAQGPIERLASMQYDFRRHLGALTGREGKLFEEHLKRLQKRADNPWVASGDSDTLAAMWQRATEFRLNLVFFIDDLDRCLPDKAVEMLEAIKLFLEVDGCAFMLAVDDEVVERGIAYRYRDYLFQAAPGTGDAVPLQNAAGLAARAGALSAPITGSEYLEKIVQLPVRLTRPTTAQVERFLLDVHGSLFGLAADVPAEDRKAALLAPENAQLLSLLLGVVPPVPRKLVRAIELLRTYAVLLESRAVVVDRRVLFVLVVLQLFAPELYRFLRRRGAYLLRDLAQWSREGRLGDLPSLARDTARARRRASENLFHLESHAALPALVQRIQDNRAGFDLRRLLDLLEAMWPDAAQQTRLWEDLQLYFELGSSRDLEPVVPGGAEVPIPKTLEPATEADLAGGVDGRGAMPQPAPTTAPPAAQPDMAPPAGRPTDAAKAPTESAAGGWIDAAEAGRRHAERPRVVEPARLENPMALIDALASSESRAWDDALAREAPALRGKVFSREDFGALLARLNESARRGAPRDWVALAEKIGPHLEPEQAVQFAALAWPQIAPADAAQVK